MGSYLRFEISRIAILLVIKTPSVHDPQRTIWCRLCEIHALFLRLVAYIYAWRSNMSMLVTTIQSTAYMLERHSPDVGDGGKYNGHSAAFQIPAFSLNVNYFNVLHRHSLRKSKSSLIVVWLQAQHNLPPAAVSLEKVMLWFTVKWHRCNKNRMHLFTIEKTWRSVRRKARPTEIPSILSKEINF